MESTLNQEPEWLTKARPNIETETMFGHMHYGAWLRKLLKEYDALRATAASVVGSRPEAEDEDFGCVCCRKWVNGPRQLCFVCASGDCQRGTECAAITSGHTALPSFSPAPVVSKGAGQTEWLDPNRGPASEWKDGVQILHPVLVAREDAEEAELAYWCDMNDEWLQMGREKRLDDVIGWQPLPVLPRPQPEAQ